MSIIKKFGLECINFYEVYENLNVFDLKFKIYATAFAKKKKACMVSFLQELICHRSHFTSSSLDSHDETVIDEEKIIYAYSKR